jgi:hypothetical protein
VERRGRFGSWRRESSWVSSVDKIILVWDLVDSKRLDEGYVVLGFGGRKYHSSPSVLRPCY